MMAALWGLLGLVVVLALVIGLLVFTAIRQESEIRDGAQKIVALRAEQQGQLEDFEDFRQEVYGHFLQEDGEIGDGVDRDGDESDQGMEEVDWDEFDPFADPPVRYSALGSL